MKNCFFFLLITFFFSLSSQAQFTLKGAIRDTSENKNLQHAVITLMSKKDSTLITYTRSNKEGEFILPEIEQGNYILLISYPKYADFADEYNLEGDLDLGSITLTPRSILLQEVVIRSGQAIKIRGDTTEFTADSFIVREGATVEDLLKKLPGLQVNTKGEITAQGRRVDKVLVDGEEFFGDDPTMATQNISAKAVDKVQVFDTKSEQQQLTGISTGSDGKTINIKLKEDQKKGGFGKFHAASDFKDYVDAKALYNRFVGKKKLSLYATKSDISTGSLNWEDRRKLGMEEDMEFDDISGFYYSFGSDDGFNDWSLRGLPNSSTAGALYSNKWNEDKHNINGSYRYNKLSTTNVGSVLTQNILPNTVNYRNRFTNSTGLNEQHAINAKYEWKVDSFASFKFTTAGLRKITDQFTNTTSEFLNMAQEFVNKSNQGRDGNTIRMQTDNRLTYKQLFKKKNRQLITALHFGVTDDDQENTIITQIEYFKNGVFDSAALIDQYKKFDGNSQTVGGKITFSEPLSAKFNLVLDYSHNRNNSSSFRNTFNKSSSGKYEMLDTAFSNNFDMNAYSHSSMAILRFVDKKLRFALGSGFSAVTLNLLNIDDAQKSRYRFLNFTPQSQLNYQFKPQTSVSINYRGTTRQPTINQLQPIRDNNDPLYEFTGNPDLKVGFNHNINAFFNEYKVLKRRGVWVSASLNFMDNAITNYNILDTLTGKQFYTPINVDGNHTWNVWSNWHKGAEPGKLGYGLQLSGNGGRNNMFVNGRKNVVDFRNIRFSFSVMASKEEKFSFEIRPEVGHNYSRSSIQPNLSNNFFTYGGNINGFIMLPGKIELRSDVRFDMRQQIDAFADNLNIIQLNSSIGRTVFKDKSGKILLVSNDILDQNRGFNRNISSTFVTEERFLRVGQYFLLRFEWSFNKVPGK